MTKTMTIYDYDGGYTVCGLLIKKWMGFTPTAGRTISYARQDAVDEWKEQDNAT